MYDKFICLFCMPTAEEVPFFPHVALRLPKLSDPTHFSFFFFLSLYEKFIRTHILNFIKDRIISSQHGFVQAKSTLSNLLETIDVINEFLSNDSYADILYLDFSKAFDSVSHYRLLIKMEALGISTNMLNIVRDFLAGVHFRVLIVCHQVFLRDQF